MKLGLSVALLVGSGNTVVAFLGAGGRGYSLATTTNKSMTKEALSMAATTTTTEPDNSDTKMLPGGMIYDEDDEAELLAKSTFPIKPDDLIQKCKDVIVAQTGIQNDPNFDESIYSDDFKFVAPFVGGPTITTPSSDDDKDSMIEVEGLNKEAYLKSLRAFDLLKAFPNMNNRYHRFYVDPFEPNRVWFQTRCVATHTGELMGNIAPTGKALVLPPQSFSMVFNEAGQVTQFHVGYVIDRTIGNTGGLGGAFGFFWGTGNALPFPECQPFQPSLQLKFLGILQKLQNLLPGGE